MSYTDIGLAIKGKLDTISQLLEVFNYEPKELTQYPCATISAKSHENAFNDLCANVRTYKFIIRLYYRFDVAADAESVLRSVTDLVVTELENDPTLAGAVDYAVPTKTDTDWSNQTREVPVKVVTLDLTARKRVNRS